MNYALDIYFCFIWEIYPIQASFKDKQSFKKCKILHLGKDKNIDPSKKHSFFKTTFIFIEVMHFYLILIFLAHKRVCAILAHAASVMFCTACYFCLLRTEWLPFSLMYWHGKQDMEMWETTESLTWSFCKSLFEDSRWTGHVSMCVCLRC